MITRAFILSLILLVISTSKSFTDELKPLRIVITPSKIAQDISKTNSFISVITEEDIKNSSATNIIELLNANTSLGIASTGGVGSTPSYFLRGFAKKYLKVTVDGLDISDPTGTQSETYLQDISIRDIKKIEILKSAQGSIHGSQAAGGLIAITTNDGMYNKKQFSQKIEYGSNNSMYSGTYYSSGKNNYKLSVNSNVYHSDGISSGDVEGQNKENDAYNYANLTLKGQLKSEKNKISFVFRDSSSKSEYDNYNQTDNHDFSKNNTQSGLLQWEFVTSENIKHIIKYNPTRVNRRTAGSYNSDQSSKKHTVEYLVQKTIADKHLIGLGAEHNNIKYKTSNVMEKRESNAIFLQTQLQPSNKLLLDLSLRRDEDQLYDQHNSHRAQIGYDISKNLRFKLSNATGYRPPSLYEGNNLRGGVLKLKPEETTNSEIGFDYKNFNKQITFSGSYFTGNIDNEIAYYYGGYGDPENGYYQGVGKTKIQGYELLAKKYFDDKISALSSYTFTDSDKNSSSSPKGSLVPMHKFNTSLNYTINENLNTNLSVTYQEKAYDTSMNELPAFTLLNSSINYKLNDNLISYFKFNNILNQDYEVNRNYGVSEFNFLAGIESKY
jgi:vitamin B12 transporter